MRRCNIAVSVDQVCDQWSIINIIPIPKSGDLTLYSNYWGISLSSLVAKVYNRMILKRIRPMLDPQLRPNQTSFRTGRTTTSQVLAIRRIIEGIKEYNLPAVLTLIDFKKAFDMVHTRARVLTPDGLTDEFQIHSGVLRGDTLAPYIFVIMLSRQSRRKVPVVMTDLDFADDIALLSELISQAQDILNKTSAAQIGLSI